MMTDEEFQKKETANRLNMIELLKSGKLDENQWFAIADAIILYYEEYDVDKSIMQAAKYQY